MGFFIKINVCHNKTEADQRSYFFYFLSIWDDNVLLFYYQSYLFHVKEEPIEVTNGLADGTDVLFLGV